MCVFSLKFNRRTAALAVLLAAALAAGVVFLVSAVQGRAPDCRENEGRIAYLAALGWQVETAPIEEKEIVLPREFDEIFTQYNEVQLAQGFDLSAYAGCKVQFFSYLVSNYPDCTDTVIANLIVCGAEVIGGDIHSAALDGFLHGLCENPLAFPQETA